MQHRRTHLEFVLSDLNASPGTVIDLQGDVITCSLQYVAGNKLELSSPGSVLKNGILRLPYGCTLKVKPADSIQLEDITLQMMDCVGNISLATEAVAADAVSCSALLHLEPGADLKVCRCRVSGCRGVGVYVGDGAQLSGESLWLERCHKRAMEVVGGRVDLEGCSLKGSGGGLLCSSHAHVCIRQLDAHGAFGDLLSAADGAELHLQHAQLAGCNVALSVQAGAQLSCRQVTFSGGQGAARLQVLGPGSTAKLEACDLKKSECTAVFVGDGGEISMTGCTVSECGHVRAATGNATTCSGGDSGDPVRRVMLPRF